MLYDEDVITNSVSSHAHLTSRDGHHTQLEVIVVKFLLRFFLQEINSVFVKLIPNIFTTSQAYCNLSYFQNTNKECIVIVRTRRIDHRW